MNAVEESIHNNHIKVLQVVFPHLRVFVSLVGGWRSGKGGEGEREKGGEEEERKGGGEEGKRGGGKEGRRGGGEEGRRGGEVKREKERKREENGKRVERETSCNFSCKQQ